MAIPPSRHSDRVHAAAETAPEAPALADVSASWRRSLNDFHVDPVSIEPPRVLTQGELVDFRAPAENMIEIGRGELNRLYSLVRDTGYVVLLCDANGIAVDHRGNEAEAELFKSWGIWLGGVWAEDVEGTNGIGTCINAARPLTVYRDQHFRARHARLSCAGAPIFGPECALTGVLDVSTMDPEVPLRAHALALRITTQAARAIELRLFRQHFSRCWIIALASGGGGDAMTMAIDADRRIIGADRLARRALALDDRSLRHGVELWTHFEHDDSLFRGNADEDLPALLRRRGDEGFRRAIVTPPASNRRGNADASGFHIRPRLTQLADMPAPQRARPVRGGLSPSVLRRVREYVDARLHETIRLETLASVAGLSVWHFAHAFKRAAGVAPHHYVLQRRVERARALLIATNRSLTEIALAVGFADHSHFARHFRRRFGMPPSAVRRNRVSPLASSEERSKTTPATQDRSRAGK